MKRTHAGEVIAPLVIAAAAIAWVWRTLPDCEAHIAPGAPFFALIAVVPVEAGFAISAIIRKRWMQLMAAALAAGACIFMLSVIGLTGYCVECDKYPPRVNALQTRVLQASGWLDAHPDGLMGWDELYNQGEPK